MFKLCTRCNTEKHLGEFRKDANTPDGVSSYCKLCRREYDKGNYASKYGEQAKARLIAHRAVNQARINAIKESNPCKCCGEADIVCLEFHHVDPSQKDFTMDTNRSWAKIELEIAKCVVICSNCHRKVHAGKIEL